MANPSRSHGEREMKWHNGICFLFRLAVTVIRSEGKLENNIIMRKVL